MSITVVIPLYNKADTIERAINSILNQTLLPSEVIVVDDGSTDDSLQKVQSLQLPFVRILNQSNSGVSAARNSGLQEAKTEWVAFLDADDELLSHQLENYKQLIELLPDAGMVATSYYLGNKSGAKAKNQIRGIKLSSTQQFINYFYTATISSPPICSSAVCVNREKALQIGGFPLGIKSGEDLLTWARMAIKFPVAYSLDAGAIFWQDDAHIYRGQPNRIPEKTDPVGKGLEKLMDECKSDEITQLKLYISHWHKMRASIYLRLGNTWLAFKEILKSLFYHPFNTKLYAYLVLLLLPLKLRNYLFRFFKTT